MVSGMAGLDPKLAIGHLQIDILVGIDPGKLRADNEGLVLNKLLHAQPRPIRASLEKSLGQLLEIGPVGP